jgi:predicted DNA-binding protein with PD1-like motif
MDHRHDGRHILVRIDRGEELVSSLTRLCAEHGIGCASLHSGIGAVRDAQVAYYDVQHGTYTKRAIREVCELVGLSGNVALVDGKPFIHAHVALAKGDLEVLGGHLDAAVVAVTAEVFLDVWEQPISREPDPDLGLNLLKFQ